MDCFVGYVCGEVVVVCVVDYGDCVYVEFVCCVDYVYCDFVVVCD